MSYRDRECGLVGCRCEGKGNMGCEGRGQDEEIGVPEDSRRRDARAGRLCCSGMCTVWAGGVLGVCGVFLGALEVGPRDWFLHVLLELRPLAL